MFRIAQPYDPFERKAFAMKSTGEKLTSCSRFIEKEDCAWSGMFDHEEQKELFYSMQLISFTSTMVVFVMLGMRTTMTMYNHVFELTFNNFTVYWMSILMRSFVPMLLNIFNHCEWNNNCELNAFVTSFLTVLELEMFTHVCIERYVVTKYVSNGWNIIRNHYGLYVFLSLFFALMYTAPVYYMNLGRYSYDFTCDVCTMDMALPNSWKKFIVISIFLLKSVKPAAFIILMLKWTRQLETLPTFNIKMRRLANVNFTKLIRLLACANLALWLPMAVVRGWVILSQLLFNQIWTPPFFSNAVYWAMLCYNISPVVTGIIVAKIDQWIQFSHYNSTDTYRIAEILADETRQEIPSDTSDHEHSD